MKSGDIDKQQARQTVSFPDKMLMPGLIDTHVHTGSAIGLTMMTRAGVTTALDLGGPVAPLVQIVKEQGTGMNIAVLNGIHPVIEKSGNSDEVVSVNGYTGIVNITKADVGLTDVDDTSDLDKPLSTINISELNVLSGNGVKSGMVLSINADPTKFNVSAGVYHTTNLESIVYAGATAQTVTSFVGNVSYIAVNIATGLLVQQSTQFTNTQRRTHVLLGTVVHSNHTSINAINNTPDVAVSLLSQYNDTLDAMGAFNVSGNDISANGGNLFINKSAGKLHKRGINFNVNTLDPHIIELASLTASTSMRYRTSAGDETTDSNSILLEWESAGVVTPISVSKFAIQRIYLFPSNVIRIQRGTAEYGSMTEAQQAIATEVFVPEANIAENGLLRSYLILKGNTTVLTDTTKALFVKVDKFGQLSAGGTSGTTSLQQAFNNSVVPQIITTATSPTLTLQGGNLNTDKLLVINNIAGVETLSILPTGVITSSVATGTAPMIITSETEVALLTVARATRLVNNNFTDIQANPTINGLHSFTTTTGALNTPASAGSVTGSGLRTARVPNSDSLSDWYLWRNGGNTAQSQLWYGYKTASNTWATPVQIHHGANANLSTVAWNTAALNVTGDITASSSYVDLTDKTSRILTPAYNTAQLPLTTLMSFRNITSNSVRIGGGTTSGQAATQIAFYTDVLNTTTGTSRMVINETGNVIIGTTATSTGGNLEVSILGTADGVTYPEMRITNRLSSSTWTVGAIQARLAAYSADASPSAGAAVRCAIDMYTSGSSGSSNGLRFLTCNGTTVDNRMALTPAGRLLVGDINDNLTDILQVTGDGVLFGIAATPTLKLDRINGTALLPTAIVSGNVLSNINFGGQYDTTIGHYSSGAVIRATATGNWTSSTVKPTKLEFYTSTTTNALALL